MAATSSEPPFDALEQAILSTVETLDRLEEFALPSSQSDNAALAVNLYARTSIFFSRASTFPFFAHDAQAFHLHVCSQQRASARS